MVNGSSKRRNSCSLILLGPNFRDQSLFMAGMGTEETVLCALKKILPHHLLKSNLFTPLKGAVKQDLIYA